MRTGGLLRTRPFRAKRTLAQNGGVQRGEVALLKRPPVRERADRARHLRSIVGAAFRRC